MYDVWGQCRRVEPYLETSRIPADITNLTPEGAEHLAALPRSVGVTGNYQHHGAIVQTIGHTRVNFVTNPGNSAV